MLIGVVSDTHGHVENTRAAVRLLESMEVKAVLHCGDICATDLVPLFQAWPTHFVFGNCDHDLEPLEQSIAAAGQTCHRYFGDFTLAERRIALLHSDDVGKFQAVIESNEYDLVCYGHTHLAKQMKVGKSLVLNPGALYRANPHTIAVVELTSMEATIMPIR